MATPNYMSAAAAGTRHSSENANAGFHGPATAPAAAPFLDVDEEFLDPDADEFLEEEVAVDVRVTDEAAPDAAADARDVVVSVMREEGREVPLGFELGTMEASAEPETETEPEPDDGASTTECVGFAEKVDALTLMIWDSSSERMELDGKLAPWENA
ncbi:hypothetical protein KLU848_1378 [Kluyveromyces marxianus]